MRLTSGAWKIEPEPASSLHKRFIAVRVVRGDYVKIGPIRKPISERFFESSHRGMLQRVISFRFHAFAPQKAIRRYPSHGSGHRDAGVHRKPMGRCKLFAKSLQRLQSRLPEMPDEVAKTILAFLYWNIVVSSPLLGLYPYDLSIADPAPVQYTRALILTIARSVLGIPDPASNPVLSPPPQLGLWERIKTALSADAFVLRHEQAPPDAETKYAELVSKLDASLYGGISKSTAAVDTTEATIAAVKSMVAAMSGVCRHVRRQPRLRKPRPRPSFRMARP